MRMENHDEKPESQGAEQQKNGDISVVLAYFYSWSENENKDSFFKTVP